MSISDRKLRANRLNSEKSTGPKTDAGKVRSRANSVKHGLSGEGVVVTAEDAAAIARRAEVWRVEYQLDSPTKEWEFEQLVVNSVRVDQCQARERAMRDDDVCRALFLWEIDQEAAAAALGDRLARRPDSVSKQLHQSKYGCLWMLDQWTGLGDVLDAGKAWSEEQFQLALDLAGIPAHQRGEATIDDPVSLVMRSCEDLEELIDERHERVDDLERTAAEQGKPRTSNKEIDRLKRYEEACLKKVRAAQRQLKACRIDTLDALKKPAKSVDNLYDVSAGNPSEPDDEEPDEEALAAAEEQKYFRDYSAAWDAAHAAELTATGIAPTPVKLREILAASMPAPPMNRKQRRAMARAAAKSR